MISSNPPADVSSVEIIHDGSFDGREWENVTVVLKDKDGDTVSLPNQSLKIYLRTAYGDAEFNPPVLDHSHFSNGSATVEILPRGRRTVVLEAKPFGTLSKPLQFRRLR